MNPTVEIILCTYNGSAYILEQIQSILRQSRPVDKISIHDDCSADETPSVIETFLNGLSLQERSLFSVFINEKNLGYAGNFSNAISHATGDILFLCDQDDIWEQDKVEKLLSYFHGNSPDMVFSDGMPVDSEGQIIGKTTVLGSYGLTASDIAHFEQNAFKHLLKRNYINGAAIAIKRESAQKALPLPCDMPHDYWLAIWCSLHDGIKVTSNLLYKYRLHRNNVIGIGQNRLIYGLLSAWRHADFPREKDLHIWKSVLSRIESLPRPEEINATRHKLNWLSSVVAVKKRSLIRAARILRSVLNGKYNQFSSNFALFRDISSLLKSKS